MNDSDRKVVTLACCHAFSPFKSSFMVLWLLVLLANSWSFLFYGVRSLLGELSGAFPSMTQFSGLGGGREEEGGGMLSSQKLLWVSELMEKTVSSWLKGTCVVSFRWKHMHQGKRAVMWGMHPGLWDLWMVHRWSELDQQSCVKAVLSHEWKISESSLSVRKVSVSLSCTKNDENCNICHCHHY